MCKILFNSFIKHFKPHNTLEIKNSDIKTKDIVALKNVKLKAFISHIVQKNQLYLSKQIFAPIKFAWEQEKDIFTQDPTPSSLRDTLQRTEVLVIIGYSFPTFNRETDKAILDNLKLIQKIYLQVPSIKTFEEIKTKILSLNNNLVHDSIKYVKAGNEFFVPFEFN